MCICSDSLLSHSCVGEQEHIAISLKAAPENKNISRILNGDCNAQMNVSLHLAAGWRLHQTTETYPSVWRLHQRTRTYPFFSAVQRLHERTRTHHLISIAVDCTREQEHIMPYHANGINGLEQRTST